MPQIKCSVVINQKMEKVLNVVRDLEKYPDYVPDIEKVKIIEDDGKIIKSLWVASLNGKRVKWKEEIIIDKDDKKALFRQIEGDFRKYEGFWHFKETPMGVEIKVYAEFEFNIPLFGAFLNNYLVERMKTNTEVMLQNIKKKAEEDG